MLHHQHGAEGQNAEYYGIGEQSPVGYMFQKEAGQNRCDNLCCHRERIIVSGVFTDVAAGADLYDHGKRIDIDRCPGKPDDTEEQVHRAMVSSIERCAQIAEGQECYADQDRTLSTNLAGQSADRDIADDGCHGGHH